MKNILAINSPIFENKDHKNTEDYLPPLGIGIIISALNCSKHQVKFMDTIAENLSLKEIQDRIELIKPDFILINIFTTNYSLVQEIVEQVKINIHWLIGGISTKTLYKEIFKWRTENLIDVIYGDGELIVVDIIRSTLQEKPTESQPGKRFFLVGKNSIYYVDNISNEKLNREIFINEPQINIYKQFEIGIYTSRGCPYNCAYCVAAFNRNTELGRIRRKSVECILKELQSILSSYPKATAIRILDDLFLSNKKSFEEAIRIFNQFNLSWRAMCHIKSINKVNDNVLMRLKKSGCKELFIGIESGSPKVLKRIHKTDDLDIVLKAVKRVLKHKINVKGYFICGFPNETSSDLDATYKLASELTKFAKENSVQFRNSTFQFRPYYGTELYDEIITLCGIAPNAILHTTTVSDIINDDIRAKSFNFDSGNYSFVSDEQLVNYIMIMNELNDELI